MSELYRLGIKEAAKGLAAREFSSVELTQAVINRIREKDGEVGAYLTFDEEGAFAAAKAAETSRRRRRSSCWARSAPTAASTCRSPDAAAAASATTTRACA